MEDGFFKALFKKWTCMHHWEIWDRVQVRDDFGGHYTVTHLVCTKCGKLKKVKSH